MNKAISILIIFLTIFIVSCINRQEEADNSISDNSIINKDFPFDEGNKILFLKYAEKLGRKDGEEKFNKLKIKFNNGDKEAESKLYKIIRNGISAFNYNITMCSGELFIPENIAEVDNQNRLETIKNIIEKYDKLSIKYDIFNKKDRSVVLKNNTSSDYDEMQDRINELESEVEELKNENR